MSDSFMISRSSPSILTSVPDHLPNRILSPALTSNGSHGAIFSARTSANGDDFAFLRFFLGCIGDDDPASGFCFCLYPANEYAVMQRTKCHVLMPSFCCFAIPPLPPRKRRTAMNVRWHSFKASANGAQIGSFCDRSRTASEFFSFTKSPLTRLGVHGLSPRFKLLGQSMDPRILVWGRRRKPAENCTSSHSNRPVSCRTSHLR